MVESTRAGAQSDLDRRSTAHWLRLMLVVVICGHLLALTLMPLDRSLALQWLAAKRNKVWVWWETQGDPHVGT